jgi:hypothetical protein
MDSSVFELPDFRPASFVRSQRGRTDLEHLGQELTVVLDGLKADLVEVIHQDYDAFLRLSHELDGTDQTVGALRAHLAEREGELKALRALVLGKIQTVDELTAHKAALHKRRRVLLLQMELARGLERCETHLATDSAALRAGEPLAPLADDARGASAQKLERLCDHLHRIATIPELEGVPAVSADTLDRIDQARAAARARALESALWAVLASNDAVLTSCLHAIDALDCKELLVQHLRERIVAPRVARLSADVSTVGSTPALLERLRVFVVDELGALTSAPGRVNTLALALAPFRLMANAIWPELVAQLIAARPGLFAPGAPAAFHANYTAAMLLLGAMERLCADAGEVAELRAHPSTLDFVRRWNLPLYFQLVLNEICAAMDACLAQGADDAPQPALAGAPALRLRASASAARALLACASAETALRPLAHRFLKLALQVLARFEAWAASHPLLHGAAAEDARASPTVPAAQPAGTADAAEPALPPTPSAPVGDPVAFGAALCADCLALRGWVHGEYARLLVTRLGLDAEPEAAALAESVRAYLGESARRLDGLLAPARAAVGAELERRCEQSLVGVRGISAAYRFQAKGLPTQPSTFMVEALEPIAAFSRAHAGRMPAAETQVNATRACACARAAPLPTADCPLARRSSQLVRRLSAPVFAPRASPQAILEAALSAVAMRYAQLVAELAQTTLRTESSIKRLQPRRQAGAASETGETGAPSDSDKIFAQLRLDAASFRTQAAGLVAEHSWPSALADVFHQLDLVTSTQVMADPQEL